MKPGDKLYHMANARFLMYDGDRYGVPYGHVEDTVTGEVTPPQPAQQLLARGYWEDYQTENDAVDSSTQPIPAVEADEDV